MSGTHFIKWSGKTTIWVRDLILNGRITRDDVANDDSTTKLQTKFVELRPYSLRQISTNIRKLLVSLSSEVGATQAETSARRSAGN